MSLVCNMDQWLGGRVLALQSLVDVSIKQSILYTSDAESTSHGDCTAN